VKNQGLENPPCVGFRTSVGKPMVSKIPTTKVRISLVITVPSSKVTTFHQDLIKRMHKYLAKYAVKVHAVDSIIE